MREYVFPVVTAAIILGTVGCGKEGGATSGDTGSPGANAKGDAATEINVEVVKYPQLQEALKARRGHIVVVDVWATWCFPCVQEFPGLVALHQRTAKDGVVCMSISLDKPDNRAAALAFLKSKGAAFPNFLLDEGEAGWDKLDLKSIPAVFVYDRAGKLARKFTKDDPDNQFTYADVNKFVDELRSQGR